MYQHALPQFETDTTQVGHYDPTGKLIASPLIKNLPFPWKVMLSTKYQGRYYFHNEQTKASAWSLPQEVFGFEPFDGLKVESVSEADSLCLPKTDKVSTSDRIVSRKIIVAASSSTSQQQTEGLESCTPLSKPFRLPLINSMGLNESQSPGEFPTAYPSEEIAHKTEATLTTRLSSSSTQDNDQPEIDQGSPNQYKIIEGIGRGGFASVLKVINLSNQNKVSAMKAVLKKKSTKSVATSGQSDESGSRSPKATCGATRHQLQLLFELNIMKTIASTSPFLLTCSDAFEDDDFVYFIIDHCGGGDLYYHLVQRSMQGRCGFSEKEAKFILAELYLAVDHLHQHKIVHRDIKIENIMLTAQGHVKLIDYGLAVELKDQPEQIMNPAGSLIYMAPELLKHRIGSRFTDWWAYGVLAHEILTGITPWSSLTDTKMIRWEILGGHLQFSPMLSRIAKVFLNELLECDYQYRLGTDCNDEIKAHMFFKGIDWDKLPALSDNTVSSSPSFSFFSSVACPPFRPGNVVLPPSDQEDALNYYLEVSLETQAENDSSSWSLGLPDSFHHIVCENKS